MFYQMVNNDFWKNISKKWIFTKKQFDKVKMQYVQNSSTARYHQLQGKNSMSFERYFDKNYN